MAVKKRGGLGKGLSALLGESIAYNSQNALQEAPTETAPNLLSSIPTPEQPNSSHQITQLPVEFVVRGAYQPRRDMHQEALQDLAESIKVQGIIQPIVVRPLGKDRYEIIAGERRWRAAQIAGLDTVPVIVRDVPDEAAIAMALIENIQREDLNPIEEAFALQRLQNEFHLTQQEVAEAIGKSRTTVTNLLRLMTLTEEVRIMLERGDLEMGHARALLTLDAQQQTEMAKRIVAEGLSVRQTESAVRNLQAEKKPSSTRENTDPDIKQLEDRLADQVGVPVMIQHTARGKGKLVFKYNSLDELDGILNHIK